MIHRLSAYLYGVTVFLCKMLYPLQRYYFYAKWTAAKGFEGILQCIL